mmetsp:Transcript_32735/g.79558  ORF Transcript_32735/g.79558 Transcript_32735/m.79558 type:complete len:584 (-) Transcript_32735:120-1871(-)|eukprot:CAMPEP_0113456262 /NCGR_PEP_ID=MMETSP0014_2-20120614/8796_1 /TAXON_ID=2857 /ORGANISM="Nitzschia sp." /LENGTH=583 /DNA_ID=CAMNT_0000347709 /DNA_START=70 /DNA_END=1821 /DNA_ORIENTATION=- /assembly_acc=CAM_ASM_000159
MDKSSPGMNNQRPQSCRFFSQRYLGRGNHDHLEDSNAARSMMRLDAVKASSLDRPYDVNVDIDDITSPTLSGENRLSRRHNGQMRRRFSVTMYNLGDSDDVDNEGDEGNNDEFVDADEYDSSHCDEDDYDEDRYGYLKDSPDQAKGTDVVADGTNLNISRSPGSYFDNQDDCYDPSKKPNGRRFLIHQPSSARILDMELPSPPLRSKKILQRTSSDNSRPSSCSSLLASKTTATHMHPQRNDRVATEKKSTPSSLSSLRPPRPSSSIWNLLGSQGKAKKASTKKTEVNSTKPRSERTTLPHGLLDLPFGVNTDEEQEHHQTPRSFDRRNSITKYNLQDMFDEDGNDDRSKYCSSKGVPAVVHQQQTQSVRNDRSSSYDRRLKQQTEAERRCKSQRDDRKVNEATSDRRLLRRAANTKKKKNLPPTPPRRQRNDGANFIDDEPCLKPVAVRPLKALTASPSKARPSPFSFSSPPTNTAKSDNRLSSSSNNHNHHQSRHGVTNTSRSNELSSPPRVVSYRLSPSLPPSSPLTMSGPTRDDDDDDRDGGDRYRSTKMLTIFKNSFRKPQMTLERSSSTRSFGPRAA